MRTSEDTLLEAGASLEVALDAPLEHEPHAWAARIDQSLAVVESAVARHSSGLQTGEGGVVEVSGGQAPSPGMDRQVLHLRRDLADLQRETEALRSRVWEVLKPDGEVARIDQVREQAAHLVAALDRYVREEANVILASATTEVGVGD